MPSASAWICKQGRIVREAAVHPQAVHRGDLGHRLDDVRDAPGDRLERRPRDVRGPARRVKSRDHAVGRRPPPRGPEAGERRQHDHAGAVWHLGCAAAARAGASAARPSPAGEPVEQRTGREHAAVERVGDLAHAAGARPARPRRPSAAAPRRATGPRCARARTRRCRRSPSALPGRTAPEPASAACWSTSCAVSGSATGQRSCAQLTQRAKVGPTARQPLAPQAERGQQLLIPVAPADREQLGARRRREVRGEAAAEAVGEEGVDRAQAQRARIAARGARRRRSARSQASLPAEK